MQQALQGVAFGRGQPTGRRQKQPGKPGGGEFLATGLLAHTPGANDHAHHALRAPIAGLDELPIEPSGVVAPLSPARSAGAEGRAQLGGPGTTRRIDRRLIRGPICAHRAASHPQGRRDLPEGWSEAPVLRHGFPDGTLPRRGLRRRGRPLRGVGQGPTRRSLPCCRGGRRAPPARVGNWVARALPLVNSQVRRRRYTNRVPIAAEQKTSIRFQSPCCSHRSVHAPDRLHPVASSLPRTSCRFVQQKLQTRRCRRRRPRPWQWRSDEYR